MAGKIREVTAKAKRAAMDAYEAIGTKIREAKGRQRTKVRVERTKTVVKKVAKAAVAVGAVAAAVAAIREVRNSDK